MLLFPGRVYSSRAIGIARVAEEAEAAGSIEIRRPEAEVEAVGGGGRKAEAAEGGGGGGDGGGDRSGGGRRQSEAEAVARRRVACAMQSRPPARQIDVPRESHHQTITNAATRLTVQKPRMHSSQLDGEFQLAPHPRGSNRARNSQ